MKRFFLLLLILYMGALTAYEKPSNLSSTVWDEALPFLFPEDHPNYAFLNTLLKKRRVTLSTETLKKSGFINLKQQPFTKITTAIHKKLPGLFFKIYLDPQKHYKRKPEYSHYLSRIRGSRLIASLVHKNGWTDSFKIPKKWMFPLPEKPVPGPLYKGVFFILVEEDMNLASNEKNLEMWKSSIVTPQFLDRLFIILTSLGLSDCVTPKNLPFSVDGRIAFIDTQTSMSFPVQTNRLSSFLTKEMRAYWEKISKKIN